MVVAIGNTCSAEVIASYAVSTMAKHYYFRVSAYGKLVRAFRDGCKLGWINLLKFEALSGEYTLTPPGAGGANESIL